MRLKILVPGIFIAVIGALFVLMPTAYGQLETGVGLAPGPTQSLYLVKVAPGNYSYLTYPLAPNDQLAVTIAAGPQPVDFFLMNAGNFSIWSRAQTATSQVYPQYAFNVKNYTFSFSGASRNQTYYLVFDSTSITSSTDVLVHSSLQGAPDSTASTAPAVIVLVGVVLALIGAKTGGRKNEELQRRDGASEATGPRPGSAASPPVCRYCGASLGENSKFCSSCGRSQG
ncbi:MAG: zinc ribbon domain-containing protein [Nitrososphaerota archaeon]|nr:zinc ribbon domain-containing protein [Nitrososphaerota archaeon]MDG7023814.1 zinc ribbon domain-containing protein [Nitrososphaerota archaeon]